MLMPNLIECMIATGVFIMLGSYIYLIHRETTLEILKNNRPATLPETGCGHCKSAVFDPASHKAA